MNLKVGQQLYRVPITNQARDGQRFVTVQKVGRKWAQIDYRERVDIETLAVDGGQYTSPAQCYLSREEYESQRRMNLAYSELREALRRDHKPKPGVIVDDIISAAKLLKIDLGDFS